MKIRWLGHASFVVTSDAGVTMITDPYKAQGGLNYGEIKESADIILISHDHSDHSNAAAVRGRPVVLKGTGVKEARGLTFKGIGTYHDEARGQKRGANTVFVFEVDGIRLCHLGDLGHVLSDSEAAEIGQVDVLLVPVGGFYTIDARAATAVVDKLSPRVVIPMHFKTPKVDTAKFGAIVGVDDFLNGKAQVKRLNGSETDFKAGQLPASTQIIVLKPAL